MHWKKNRLEPEAVNERRERKIEEWQADERPISRYVIINRQRISTPQCVMSKVAVQHQFIRATLKLMDGRKFRVSVPPAQFLNFTSSLQFMDNVVRFRKPFNDYANVSTFQLAIENHNRWTSVLKNICKTYLLYLKCILSDARILLSIF